MLVMCLVWTGQAIWVTLPSSGTKCFSEEIQNNVVILADYVVIPDDHSHSPTIFAKPKRHRHREMEDNQSVLTWEEEEEHAKVDVWKYVFGFVEIAVVKCAVELGIAEAIETRGSPMALLELSSALRCDPSHLYRIMRVLVHLKIFKEQTTIQLGSKSYAQTPLSRLLLKSRENSMAALILLESSPTMLAPWHGLSSLVQGNLRNPLFEEVHGKDLWSFGVANPDHNKLFNEAMACDARLAVPALVKSCVEVFKGVGTLGDVGGGNGTTLRLLVEACPWIQGINFDLPHVVPDAQKPDRIENVGGDMFDCVPKADAVIIKWVLHDWGDDDCIRILKKCREAIPIDKGKVIIVEAVIDEKDEKANSKLTNARLMLDMVMIAHTGTGKERTMEEWEYVLGEAGFSRHTITPIHAIQSVIQAFP